MSFMRLNAPHEDMISKRDCAKWEGRQNASGHDACIKSKGLHVFSACCSVAFCCISCYSHTCPCMRVLMAQVL